MKYNISREFFPFTYFTPPISRRALKIVVPLMKVPRYIFKDKELEVSPYPVRSYDGEMLKCFLMIPKSVGDNAPCLVYIHGGGFVLEAVGYHYKNAMRYAKDVGCKLLFVNYRLAPKHPHPVFFEDCYAAASHIYENAEGLGIDRARMGIGGDSAGAALAVGVLMMAKERRHPMSFLFQMLPYPFLDARNDSRTFKEYYDTPVWNSTLSRRVADMTMVDKNHKDYLLCSPVEAEDFSGFPTAYIETAQFDCLHDDGILYARRLREAGIQVTLNETEGTMHGFDIVQRASITQKALDARVTFMKGIFACACD